MCSSVPSEVGYPADAFASLDLSPWGKPMGSLVPLRTFFYFRPLQRYVVSFPPPQNVFISDLSPVQFI